MMFSAFSELLDSKMYISKIIGTTNLCRSYFPFCIYEIYLIKKTKKKKNLPRLVGAVLLPAGTLVILESEGAEYSLEISDS